MSWSDIVFMAIFMVVWFILVTKVLPRFGVRS